MSYKDLARELSEAQDIFAAARSRLSSKERELATALGVVQQWSKGELGKESLLKIANQIKED